MGTFVVLLILIVIVGLIVYSMVSDKKNGKSSCGGNCASCGNACACHGSNKSQSCKKKSKS